MHFLQIKNRVFLPSLLLISLSLGACSQSSNALNQESSGSMPQTSDSMEQFNRDVFKFNVSVDKLLIKPIAKAYKKVTPEVVDTGVTNFFHNLGDVGNAVNNLLQLKIGDAVKDTERFVFNSSFGIGGLFDIATEMGLERHKEDFGQTLATWGVSSGSYVMLPVFGPSTLRDATAKFSIDTLLDPTNYSEKSLEFFVLENLDKRADLLSTEDAFKDFSDDQYVAVRDAWLQRREYLIKDGKVDEKKQTDLIDELEDLDDE